MIIKIFNNNIVPISIKAFNKKVADEVIHNRNGVELMNGLGRIFVGTCKSPKKKNIDIPDNTIHNDEFYYYDSEEIDN